MAALSFLALHVCFFVASILAHEQSGVASHGARYSPDELCQGRSTSLLQSGAVKTRIEPGAASLGASVAATALTSVNSSDGGKEVQATTDALAPVAEVASDAHAAANGVEQKLLVDATVGEKVSAASNSTQSASPMVTTDFHPVAPSVTETIAADAAIHQNDGMNLTTGAIAGADTVPTQYVSSKAIAPAVNHATEAAMPSDHEMNTVDEEALPPQSQGEGEGAVSSFAKELRKGIKDVDEFLRGKPEVLSIFVMMMLPAGICAVMCCVFNIIRVMEDGHTEDDDGSLNSGGTAQPRPTLGEVMHPHGGGPQGPYEPLCAELLAPGCDNECLIALPSVSEVSSGVCQFERMIMTKTGQPMVTVRIAVTQVADGMPDVAGGGSYGVPGQMLERISLIAYKKQNALGFCELRVPNGGVSAARPLKCSIYRPTGDLFATLEEESTGVVSSLLAASSSNVPRGSASGSAFGTKCYMLTTVATGTRFWIQGDIEKRSLVVVSESDEKKPVITVDSGEELQFKREEQNYYRLRVQPRADAGVVIMALLAMDRLRGSHS